MQEAGLHINLLGPLEVVRNGQPVEFPSSRKTRALLAYLVATGKKHSRNHLCDLLWEGPADPRAALRWSLSKIRLLLNDEQTERIMTGQNRIQFVSEGADIDLFRIQSLCGAEAVPASLEDLEYATSLFRGAFLEGCDIPECYRFCAWLDGRREAWARLHDRLFIALIERLQDTPEKAIHYARRLLQINPFNEQAHILLIRLLGKSGDITKALDQYNLCRTMLKEELNVAPSPELEQARISLMTIAAPVSGTKVVKIRAGPPFTGRLNEQNQIDRILDEADRNLDTGMILITGDPGIGKTRLLQHVKDRIAETGRPVLWSTAYYSGMNHSYAPWTKMLKTIPGKMIPEAVRGRLAPLLSTTANISNGDRNRLFNAVLELFRLLNADRNTPVLLFDNLHWFDKPSLSLLHYLSRETRGPEVIFICSARTAELEENPEAFRLVHALKKEKLLHHLPLPPLTAEETGVVVKAIDPGLDTKKIYKRCKGNPFYAQEIAYALKTGGDEEMPDSLLNLIGDRLALLSPETRNLLNWAAVWRYDFGLEELSLASDYPFPQLLASVEVLEHYHIIKPVRGDRYTFNDELVQNAAYRNLPESKRKMFHRRIAGVILGLKEKGAGNGLSAAILYHAERSGDDELAARAYLLMAHLSLNVFAYEETAKLVEKGLNHVGKLPDSRQMDLRPDLLELYVDPGMASFRKPDLVNQLKRCVGEARRLGRTVQVRKVLFIIAYLHYQQGDFRHALERSAKAEEAGRSADPLTMIQALADTARCFGMIGRNMKRAEALALEARSLAVEMDLEDKIYEIPMALALVNHHKGLYDEAIRLYHQAIGRIGRQENHWWKCYNLQQLPMVELERGRPAGARKYCRRLLPVALKMGEGSEVPFARALAVLAEFHMGKTEAAPGLDHELEILRRLDSKWMIAWLQVLAAERDLAAGNFETARQRAEEAREKASLVGRLNEKTWACALLIRLLINEGKRKKAAEILAAIQNELKSSHPLSARATRALKEANDLVNGKI